MAKVLFVKANSRPIEQSVSVKLYHAFLDSYKSSHPEDDISELDLFQENLPYYDADKISGMFKLGRGLELTEAEQKATDTVLKYLNPFLEADKVVFAFPLWNMTVPAVLHTYVDYLNQVGRTFRYTAEGAIGLLGNKKVALLNASGGIYTDEAGPREMAVSFMVNNLALFGVRDIVKVVVAGHNQYPDKSEQIIREGLEKAAAVALEF